MRAHTRARTRTPHSHSLARTDTAHTTRGSVHAPHNVTRISRVCWAGSVCSPRAWPHKWHLSAHLLDVTLPASLADGGVVAAAAAAAVEPAAAVAADVAVARRESAAAAAVAATPERALLMGEGPSAGESDVCDVVSACGRLTEERLVDAAAAAAAAAADDDVTLEDAAAAAAAATEEVPLATRRDERGAGSGDIVRSVTWFAASMFDATRVGQVVTWLEAPPRNDATGLAEMSPMPCARVKRQVGERP
jgi:hypothetical protein